MVMTEVEPERIELANGSDEYKQLANDVLREMILQQKTIIDVKPNQHSRLLDMIKNQRGRQMFGMIYTGGVIQASQEEYRNVLLGAFLQDLKQGKALLAWTERCPGELGVRCYFEFDYRSFVRFPTQEEMIAHCKLAQELVLSCCNEEDSCECYVAKCTRKLKFAKPTAATVVVVSEEAIMQKPNLVKNPKLAIGLHIVFPNVVFTPAQIRQLCLTLDTRITAQNPFFAGTVDPASVKKECCMLRPIYSYRMDECKGCYPQRSHHATKTRKRKKLVKSKYLRSAMEWSHQTELSNVGDSDIDYDSDSQEEAPPLFGGVKCHTKGCWSGKQVASPSIYTPWIILNQTREVVVPEAIVLEHWVMDMSIIPECSQPLSQYKEPIDAPQIEDPIHRNYASSAIFKCEIGAVKQKISNKTSETISGQEEPQIFSKVTEIIQSFLKPRYRFVIATKIVFNRHDRRLSVDVLGKGFKDCVIGERQHQTNRVFFTLRLKPKIRSVYVECYNTGCRSLIQKFKKKNKEELTEHQVQLLSTMRSKIPDNLFYDLMQLLHLHTGPNIYAISECPLRTSFKLVDEEDVKTDKLYNPKTAMFEQPSLSTMTTKPLDLTPCQQTIDEKQQTLKTLLLKLKSFV